MKLRNELWIIKFIFKKKRVWNSLLLAIVYFILVPYQKNLIRYFGSAAAAEEFFWKSAFLYHGVSALTFMFQAAIQLMDTEMWESGMMWKKQIRFVLGGIFVLYQILMLPVYIWYASIYAEQLLYFVVLLSVQIISVIIFYMIAFISHKTIAGFLVVFIGLLLAF